MERPSKFTVRLLGLYAYQKGRTTSATCRRQVLSRIDGNSFPQIASGVKILEGGSSDVRTGLGADIQPPPALWEHFLVYKDKE
ncbi:MAG: hypothetical protein ABSG01_10005 [Anaerolineales bacterium]|jgi:hypothetical protein